MTVEELHNQLVCNARLKDGGNFFLFGSSCCGRCYADDALQQMEINIDFMRFAVKPQLRTREHRELHRLRDQDRTITGKANQFN